MKKLLLSIVGLLIVGAIALPLVIKNQVESQIEVNKQSLLKNGMELNIIKEDGYISTTRDYTLKIINGKKFRDYILEKFIQIDPNYKVFIELMQKNTKKNIRIALDGTTFSGTIKNSNLLLFPTKIELSLVKLSAKIMSGLKPNDKVSDNIKLMLNEKKITFFITLDSNQNVSQIIMKDIDEDIKDKGKVVNFKLKGHKLDLDITKSLKGSYTIDTQSVKSDRFEMQTKGINYTFDYLTQFQNDASIHVDSFSVLERKNSFKVGNIDIGTNVKDADNKTLKINVNYKIKDVYFKEKMTAKLDSFVLNLDIFDLDKEGLVSVNEAYSKIALNSTSLTQKDIEALTNGVQKILNSGIKAQINSSISNLIFKKTNLNKIDFKMNMMLNPNTNTLKGFQMIQAVEIDGSVTMNKSDVQELLKLDRSLERFAKLGKKDGDNVVFNYEFKKGSLYLNGNKL